MAPQPWLESAPLPVSHSLVADEPAAVERQPEGYPWRQVNWSLMYLALLGYLWVVITYSFQGASIFMATALVGLLLEGEARLPAIPSLYAAFLAWGALGYFGSPYPSAVLDRLDIGWKLGLIALVAANSLRTRARTRFFTFFMLGAFALYPVRGTLFSYAVGGTVMGRAAWNYIYSNPNDLAALLLFPLAMSIGTFAVEPKGWPKFAALTGIVLIPIVILLTQSRGAFLALAVFALFAIAGSKRKIRIIGAVVVIGVVAAIFIPNTAWQRFEGLSKATEGTQNLSAVDPEGSAEQRFEIWKVAAAIIHDHPIAGAGIGTYKEFHRAYAAAGTFKDMARGARDTHSTYLNVTAETGYIGLALFLLMFGLPMYQAEKMRRRIRTDLPRRSQQLLALNLGLVGYFLAAIFGSYAALSFPYVYLALLGAMTVSHRRRR